MERNSQYLNWESNFYLSKEKCTISKSEQEIVIRSAITGRLDNVTVSANYQIKATFDWKVRGFEINYSLNGLRNIVAAYHEADGWIVNGQLRREFNNCIDIDITLTPFTNSLPINRLDLKLNEPQQIEVFYIDLLENSTRVARQQYTKKSDRIFNFQNVPNDFEADIIVDSNGFVIHYPKLFERV